MQDVRKEARELMKGYCRVCKECDGRACAGEVPGMGGLGTAASFKGNVEALADYKLRMRTIHDCSEADPSTSVLGYDLSIPVFAAPIGGVSFNMGGKVSEEDYIMSKLKACDANGIVGCTGDGVPPFISEAGFDAIKAVSGNGIPFIKPWEGEEFFEKIEKAAATGCTTFGIDIDAIGLITLAKMGRPVAPRGVERLKALIERIPGKVLLKGIMTPEDAQAAVEAGAAGIVVSNHGGRVLDHTPGTAHVIAEIAEAVNGEIAVLVDGGVRTGVDVLKMVALGADAVMIGRPFSIATMGGLEDGASKYIQQLTGQIKSAMVLTGCETIDDVNLNIITDVLGQ
ncbi:alpha-hydroxy-acid oxidizing protein [Halodesulfovibrio sp. MK-HDV]|jgi:4-hydroxymandelate oxidase|uniref:alpha-hydroxy-acid oxidizing protein n=1 Tax=Halodesulfovibrio sp. MK-HDV TaxID=2599925 RepID=UPI00136DC14A|nr:alpha-hydroxy-acid oxidizing protein [Halodesulfovibrio sp. MK-HDV]KAF1074399.1 4-hydroxymandelate oxidase [Halodesulfovibrio sp. MK-HDV]